MSSDAFVVEIPGEIVHHAQSSDAGGSNGAAIAFTVILILIFLVVIGMIVAYFVWWANCDDCSNTSRKSKTDTKSDSPDDTNSREFKPEDFNW